MRQGAVKGASESEGTGKPLYLAGPRLMEGMLVTAVDGSYAGDLAPEEAFELLGSEVSAALIDVRTQAEWNFVGTADLAPCNKASLLVEWQRYPAMEVNEGFVAEVEAALNMAAPGNEIPGRDTPGSDKERSLLFLCRSGVRSIAAAETMTGAGYAKCFNVTEGFEGSLDAEGHRGMGGWKARGLPWRQR